MENLFQSVGIDYKTLPENTSIDIYEDNINIKSFNHEKNQIEFKRITRLVRKENSEMYKISSGNYSFMATPEHKVFTKEFGYIELKDIKQNCFIMLDTNEFSELILEKLEGIHPVLDMTVEDNENYFSNNILSHNSPDVIGVGNAMKFYASIRIKTSKAEVEKTDEEGQENIDVNMLIFKNKIGVPFKKASFTLNTGKDGEYGIDTMKELIEYAIKFDLVKKAGSWFTYTPGNGADEKLGQGMPNVKKFFKDNPIIFESVKETIMNKIQENRKKEVAVTPDSFTNKMSELSEEKTTKRRSKKEEAVEEKVQDIKDAEILPENLSKEDLDYMKQIGEIE